MRRWPPRKQIPAQGIVLPLSQGRASHASCWRHKLRGGWHTRRAAECRDFAPLGLIAKLDRRFGPGFVLCRPSHAGKLPSTATQVRGRAMRYAIFSARMRVFSFWFFFWHAAVIHGRPCQCQRRRLAASGHQQWPRALDRACIGETNIRAAVLAPTTGLVSNSASWSGCCTDAGLVATRQVPAQGLAGSVAGACLHWLRLNGFSVT